VPVGKWLGSSPGISSIFGVWGRKMAGAVRKNIQIYVFRKIFLEILLVILRKTWKSLIYLLG